MKKMGLINRELSWLSFNERVLQESMDENVPLIERMRFLGIYSNNLDEFFKVRVATVRRMTLLKQKSLNGFKGDAVKLIDEINQIVVKQSRVFQASYKRIIEELKHNSIFQLDETNLNTEQVEELSVFFNSRLKHEIVPVLLSHQTPFPKLHDESIYLAVKIQLAEKGKKRFSLIEIPAHYSRFYTMQDQDNHYFILMDDIIRLHLESIYSIFDFQSVEAFTFKFTRDAELDLDDDLSVSIFEKMEKSVKMRKKGDPVRFVYDSKMPKDLKNYLLEQLDLDAEESIIPGGKYHNFKDFASFPDFGKKELVYKAQPQADAPEFKGAKSLLKIIEEKEVLLHFPYQKFDHVVDILREAAIDPKVKSIKINIYRLAQNSQIINALLNAVRNGKEVVAIMELQARFDEVNNMHYAEMLQEQGAKVIYGIQNLKIHSKLLLITRTLKGKETLYAYIGTGNFNEKTSRIYTDLALLTHKRNIVNEVKKVFELLENNINRGLYKNLLVSPFNNRRKLLNLVKAEMENAKNGIPAFINIKVNNLVDTEVIEKLYKAAASGVKIRLIVRGICCLIPGENIEAISIVGRYLEHSRIMIFGNGGKPLHYISSADLMERNLDRRIEVGVPVQETELQEKLDFIFETQWSDNQKARKIEREQKNKYRRPGGKKTINAQEVLYEYYVNLAAEKNESEE